MVLAGFVAHCGLAPRGNRAGTAHRALALAAAVRVIAGVHYRAAHCRAPAHVALAAGLAEIDILVIDVANLADRGNAVHRHVAHLAGGQAHQGVLALLRHQLRHVAGGTHQLRALAGIQLDVVHNGAHGDVRERQAVARLDVGVRAAHNGVAHRKALGRDDIALLAVLVLHQRDMRRAVGIVFQRLDGGRHIQLVALKIDHAVFCAVAAAVMAHGDAAGIVAAGRFLHRFEQASLRLYLRENRIVGHGHAAAARRSRFILFDRHVFSLSSLMT